MPLLCTILTELTGSKPQRDYLVHLLPLLTSLPDRPTYRNLAHYGGRGPHTNSSRPSGPTTTTLRRSIWLTCARWAPMHVRWPGLGTAV